MNRMFNQSLAAAFAAVLALGSVGAIVTVPPVHAEVPSVLTLPVIA